MIRDTYVVYFNLSGGSVLEVLALRACASSMFVSMCVGEKGTFARDGARGIEGEAREAEGDGGS